MAKIYTRTGDEGSTSLLGGSRVRKDVVRIESIGSVDETNAALGLARVELRRSSDALARMDELLGLVQHRLFDLGAELASIESTPPTFAITDSDVASLESAIDQWDATLPALTAFILPGGSPVAAQLHQARCICRRAERALVRLAADEPVRGEVLRYVNRLSDLLFVLARAANAACGVLDVTWQQREPR